MPRLVNLHLCLDYLTLFLPQLDLDDFNVENAYFRSFDSIVRRQLDPVWHKVGLKTKQLVSDLATLRSLLTYASIHSSSFVYSLYDI